ncbi:MAG: hypothetical protein EXR27_04005 [Betaproteobacteria bacterium]|nr:hypothetical protein [Betaproteobacteria bacterium]
MASIRLSTTQYLHTLPVITRSVSVPGLDYDVTVAKSIDESTLKTLAGEFDVGESSLANFLKVSEPGGRHDGKFVALPVFAKKLVSQYAFCREDDDLDGHGSLAGKRIALPQFWITAAVWHRWYMEQHGVSFASAVWCPLAKDRIEGMSYPDAAQIDWSLLGRKPLEVIREGAADCFIFARRPENLRGLRYLAKQPLDTALEVARRTGVVPLTHVLILRRELLASRPELGASLYELFSQALAAGRREAGNDVAQFLPLGDLQLDAATAALGAGWNDHGWTRNEKALRTFCAAAVKQGMVKSVDVEQVFLKIG